MFALGQLATGLLVAHLAWAIFFVTGTLFDHRRYAVPSSWARSLWRIVSYTLAGIAVWGFEGFILGLTGLFNTTGLVIAASANLAAFPVIRRENPFRRVFWSYRFSLFVGALRGPGAFIYGCSLLLSAPAVIPDFSSDGVRVHLAYAYDWVRVGRIYAEQRMRFPYYAFNIEIIYGWMMIAKAARYVTFFSWLTGTLSSLGIAALIALFDERAQRARGTWQRVAANGVYAIMPLSFMLCAAFLRWWPTAMPDATSTAFFLAIAGTLALAYLYAGSDLLWMLVPLIAFFAGIKPSYLFFVPFLALAALLAARRFRLPFRHGALIAVAIVIFASPWYVYNLIRDGDPVPPVFNLAIRGADPNFSREDWAAIRADLAPPRSIGQWVTYPVTAFLDPQSAGFREYGSTLVILAVYAIVIVAPLLLFRVGKPPEVQALAALFGIGLLGIAYLVLSSALLRYALLIYPLLAVATGILLLDTLGSSKRAIFATPLLAALAALPSPGSSDFYHQFRGVYYDGLTQVLPNDNAALARFVAGYVEAEPIFDSPVLRQRRTDNVYLVEAPLNYYIELHGGRPLGDWTGAYRYGGLIAAIDGARAAAYADENRIGAFVIERNGPIVAEELAFLTRQLRADGFSVSPSSDDRFLVLIRR